MKRMTALLIAYLLVVSGVSAQTATPTPYIYVANTSAQFESETANMTYDSNWYSETWERISTTSGVMSFWVRGKFLMVWRRTTNYLSGTSIQICVSGSCSTYSNYNSYYGYTTEPAIYTLPDATNNYQVQISCLSFCGLDYFMILSEASALVYPTPTPITFPTGIPTWTPAPTITPIGLVLAIDPAAHYSSANGQITKFEYSSSAADTATFVILITLLFSVWGFFLLIVFVAWRYPQWRR